MREKVRSLGVALRPHMKTAKSIDVLKVLSEGRDMPITVSTLAEARYFFERGVTDILYAVGIAPAKLPEVAELIRAAERHGANVILGGIYAPQSEPGPESRSLTWKESAGLWTSEPAMRFRRDVLERYGRSPAVTGWYAPNEYNPLQFESADDVRHVVEATRLFSQLGGPTATESVFFFGSIVGYALVTEFTY